MHIDKAHLEQFLRTKIELETLTDAQIARVLHVGSSTVSHWRHNFRIKPADKFKRKFQEKYGPDAFESFDSLIRHGATLQEIGRSFGFSREYARQVYNKLYQGSYSAHQRQRAQAMMRTSSRTNRASTGLPRHM
jgi:DNA-binding CsgD family transcriptional regulator